MPNVVSLLNSLLKLVSGEYGALAILLVIVLAGQQKIWCWYYQLESEQIIRQAREKEVLDWQQRYLRAKDVAELAMFGPTKADT